MISATDLAALLRTAGLRVTGPRLAIFAAVRQNRTHPSAEQIHLGLAETHPSLSLSTVYSTLGLFLKAGLIRNVQGADGRLRIDGLPEEHDHAVCRHCGAIFDIDPSRLSPRPVAGELPGGLHVLNLRIEYDVVCSACQTQVEPTTTKMEERANG